jgi:Cu(I)/Ag(I) efflux system membrane fusion protein
MKTISTILAATISFFLLTSARAQDATKPLPAAAKAVFDQYMSVQTLLAKDSMGGVSEAATNIVKEMEGDAGKVLPAAVASSAKAVADAQDLQSARDAFKGLSDVLLNYLKEEMIKTGRYYEVFCPDIKASWLQEADKTVRNPYQGASSKCGVVLNVH